MPKLTHFIGDLHWTPPAKKFTNLSNGIFKIRESMFVAQYCTESYTRFVEEEKWEPGAEKKKKRAFCQLISGVVSHFLDLLSFTGFLEKMLLLASLHFYVFVFHGRINCSLPKWVNNETIKETCLRPYVCNARGSLFSMSGFTAQLQFPVSSHTRLPWVTQETKSFFGSGVLYKSPGTHQKGDGWCERAQRRTIAGGMQQYVIILAV